MTSKKPRHGHKKKPTVRRPQPQTPTSEKRESSK